MSDTVNRNFNDGKKKHGRQRQIALFMIIIAFVIGVCAFWLMRYTGVAMSENPSAILEVADGEAADGEAADDEVADGEAADGDVADSDAADGNVADGEAADSEVADSDAADSDVGDGDVGDSDVDDGDVTDSDGTNSDGANSETADGDVADGDAADGEVADGDAADSEVADGEAADSEVADTEAADSEVADTEAADGGVDDGEAADSDVADGDGANSEAADGDAADNDAADSDIADVFVLASTESMLSLEEYADIAEKWSEDHSSVRITIKEKTDCILENSCSYYYQISLPEDVELEEGSGKVLAENGIDEVEVGTWTVSSGGALIIVFNDEIDNYSGFEGWIEISQLITTHPAEVPCNANISKEYIKYSATERSVVWKIEVVVPAYSGSGTYSEWAVEDLSNLTGNYTDWANAIEDVTLFSSIYADGITLYPIELVHDDASVSLAYYIDGKYLYLVNRCNCSSELCRTWIDDSCSKCLDQYSDWCFCWNSLYNSTVYIDYMEDVSEELQSAVDLQIENDTYYNSANLCKNNAALIRSGQNGVVPLLLGKEQTETFSSTNDYTAKYSIEINKSKVDYSGLDQVIITDTLQNLVYALGSMSIVTDTSLVLVPCEGIPEEREENKYFSVSVGTEADSDEQVLTITIWYPTDCMYTIIYNAMLNLPDYTSSSAVVDYSNTAFLNCDGKGNLLYHKLRDSFYLSDDWKVDNLQVEITKVDSGDGETTLEGAEFGLFSENGVLITKGITDSDGKVVFTTMRSAGILIRRNTAYYVQEITPPEGYVLDNTRHWFCFADNTIDVNLPEGVVATINKVDEGGAKAVIYFVIENMSGFALPGTGGIGTLIPTITGSLLFMVAGCFLLFNIVPQKTVKNGRKDKGG